MVKWTFKAWRSKEKEKQSDFLTTKLILQLKFLSL